MSFLFRTDAAVLRAQGATQEINQIDQALDKILATVRAELAKARERLAAAANYLSRALELD